MLPNREVDAAASSADIYYMDELYHCRRKAVNPSRQIEYQYLTQKDESNDASAIEAASGFIAETTPIDRDESDIDTSDIDEAEKNSMPEASPLLSRR